VTAAWALLRGLPWRLIGCALAIAALVWFVYTQGVDAERDRWLAKAAAQAQADAAAYATEVQANDKFVRAAMNEQLDLQDQLNAIQRITRNVKSFSLLAPVSAGQPAGAGCYRPDQELEQRARLPGINSGPVALSLGAVWLWNAALTGQAAPAGACSIDAATGQASAACAGTSGISLDAAWDNHTTNAATCALDRANHQRLINFIHQREQSLAPPPLGAPHGSTN
jgi:hypothetical protein